MREAFQEGGSSSLGGMKAHDPVDELDLFFSKLIMVIYK